MALSTRGGSLCQRVPRTEGAVPVTDKRPHQQRRQDTCAGMTWARAEGEIVRWAEIQATGPSSRVIPFSFMFYLSFPFRFFQIPKV